MLLSEFGADIAVRIKSGGTALNLAALSGHAKVVGILINKNLPWGVCPLTPLTDVPMHIGLFTQSSFVPPNLKNLFEYLDLPLTTVYCLQPRNTV